MIQRDYLKRQLDQLGLVLSRLLTSLLGRTRQDPPQDDLAIVHEIFKQDLSLDLDTLLALPGPVLVQTLTAQHGFEASHLSTLADILYALAGDQPGTEGVLLYAQAGHLYQHLSRTGTTYDLSWGTRLEHIRALGCLPAESE